MSRKVINDNFKYNSVGRHSSEKLLNNILKLPLNWVKIMCFHLKNGFGTVVVTGICLFTNNRRGGVRNHYHIINNPTAFRVFVCKTNKI